MRCSFRGKHFQHWICPRDKWQEQLGSALVAYVSESTAESNVFFQKRAERKGTIWDRLPEGLPAACTIDGINDRKFPQIRPPQECMIWSKDRGVPA
jgi:hypothetical protein